MNSGGVKKFWNLVKGNLDEDGLLVVASQYPQFREEAINLTSSSQEKESETLKVVDNMIKDLQELTDRAEKIK